MEKNFKKIELSRFLSIRPSLQHQRKIKPIEIIKKIETPTLFIGDKLDLSLHYWHTKMLYQEVLCPMAFKFFEKGFLAEDLFLHNKQEFDETCLNWLKNQEHSKLNTDMLQNNY